jgi:hypothetical protein
MSPKYKRESQAPAAPVAVSHVEPQAPRPSRAEFGRRILDALQGGSLTSAALAAACDTLPNDKKYARARAALEVEKLIVCLGRQGRQLRYSLPEAPAVEAA